MASAGPRDRRRPCQHGRGDDLDQHAARYRVDVGRLLFFAYGHAYGWIYATVAHVSPVLLHLFLTQAFLALLLVGQLAIRRARDLAQPTIAAHLMAGLLLLMAVAPILAGGVRSGPDPATRVAAAMPVEGDAGPAVPDIYLIVLDSYARQDVLEEHYGFDNQPMLDSLGTLGFQVATDSRSSYRFANPTAIHLPDDGRVRGDIPDDITPVNVFRMLLERYLGLDLKLLPNRYLYSPFMDGHSPIDVTSELTTKRREATAGQDQSPR